METSDVLALIALVLSSATALAAIGVSVYWSRRQDALARDLRKQEEILTQRQMFVEVWPHLVNVRQINPHSPPPADEVWHAVNVLDLIAICWEAEIVSEDVLKRTTSEMFLKLYESINEIQALDWKVGDGHIKRSGAELLRECPVIGQLYKLLDDQRKSKDAVPRLGSHRP